MDAIITAGGVCKPNDPLYKITQIKKKALIPLAGRPMVSWVIDAVVNANVIDNLVIIGLDPDEITPPNVPTYYLKSAGSLLDNLLTSQAKLLSLNPSLKKILLCSSDIPLVTPEIIQGFLSECGNQQADLYYAVVEEKTMEQHFPNSKRSYIPAKGGRYTGGDAFLVRANLKPDTKFMNALIGARKNYFQQMRLFGFGLIFRFLFRRLTAFEGVLEAGKRVGIDQTHIVSTQHPELAMDLDKPDHYHIIKTVLEKRERMVAR